MSTEEPLVPTEICRTCGGEIVFHFGRWQHKGYPYAQTEEKRVLAVERDEDHDAEPRPCVGC